MLLGQFSVTFQYRPGAQNANADGMSRQCGQCMRPGCPVSSPDSTTELLDQPFASSEMGDSMNADLLPDLSGETWVAATYLDVLTTDLPATGSDMDFIVASRHDETVTTVCQWVQTAAAPVWSQCSGLYLELRCWRLQFGNLSVDKEGRLWHRRAPPALSSQLVVPARERQDLIRRYHNLSPTGPRLLAGATLGCTLISGRLCDLFVPEVSLPTGGSHGTCRGGSPMGSGGHGYSGHVSYKDEGQPLRPGNGGLFLSMDGGLPVD